MVSVDVKHHVYFYLGPIVTDVQDVTMKRVLFRQWQVTTVVLHVRDIYTRLVGSFIASIVVNDKQVVIHGASELEHLLW